MAKRMLIDATHKEETRVAVVSGNRLEEYDFESVVRKQLKSNIYLVKVTRVEPSLQAAFVDFGGNRHGFLPFPEIHPDYYKIPVSDREDLLAEQDALALEEVQKRDAEEEEKEAAEQEKAKSKKKKTKKAAKAEEEKVEEEVEASENTSDDDEDEEVVPQNGVAEISGEDPLEEEEEVAIKPSKLRNIKRQYKIQEVIKRNQVMLVQIRKEERGNKGAAVTTYLSLPGRYCVLMPNSPRAGGVSRKVTNIKDRQKMKKLLSELDIPEGMSVIMRTAGLSRSKTEIKRDLDYLLRLWNNIRELTMTSTAPSLVHEEGNLVKRSIRDLYKRDIDEILVAGDKGYRTAKEFMKTLMPSHASRVKKYKDDSIPLYFRYQVENQIDEIHSTVVQLKSGGYIDINQTEALVAVDVNSGRATKGRHIEETALRTNIEAAEEVARQLRLRDMGGLVVIDFIDMEEQKNNRIVERKLKEAMQNDRARIQMGRISAFGLLELSRQRLRPSLVESNYEVCQHCKGSGLVRTIETSAVIALRAIEEEGLRGRAKKIRVSMPTEVALYLFNRKRDMLAEIEARHEFKVNIEADDQLIKPDFNVALLNDEGQATVENVQKDEQKNADQGEQKKPKRRRRRRNKNNDDKDLQALEAAVEKGEDDNNSGNVETIEDENNKPKRRRRRRSRNRNNRREGENLSETLENNEAAQKEAKAKGKSDKSDASEKTDTAQQANDDQNKDNNKSGEEGQKRRPRRRGMRRTRKPEAEGENSNQPSEGKNNKTDAQGENVIDIPITKADDKKSDEKSDDEKPARKRRTRKPAATKEKAAEKKTEAVADKAEAEKPETKAKAPQKAEAKTEASKAEPVKATATDTAEKKAAPAKKGWWQKLTE